MRAASMVHRSVANSMRLAAIHYLASIGLAAVSVLLSNGAPQEAATSILCHLWLDA